MRSGKRLVAFLLNHDRFSVIVFSFLFAGDGVPNTIGWVGWALLCALIGVWAVMLALRGRSPLRAVPVLLWLFLGWCAVSIIWSHWRPATAASVLVQALCVIAACVIATTLTLPRVLATLSLSLRLVVAGSLIFELFTAAVLRHPVLPVWAHYEQPRIPAAFYFSRAELLTGGQIQGLPGNSNLLALVALLALITTLIQWQARQLRAVPAAVWCLVALGTLGLTRSATIVMATVCCAIVFMLAAAIRRVPAGRRLYAYLAGFAVICSVVVIGFAQRAIILGALGKTSTLTGRSNIWAAVAELINQHPALGWGWIGYWWPSVAPLNHLVRLHGVTYLQAHNAYLDVWMQTGIIGLVLFSAYVLTALVRGWRFAIATASRQLAAQSTVRVLPLMLLVALLGQSFTESRLLYQGNWVLLAVIAVELNGVAARQFEVCTRERI